MDLAKRIILYRAKHGLTQAEFAKEVGIGAISVHRAENNTCGKMVSATIENYLNEKGEV